MVLALEILWKGVFLPEGIGIPLGRGRRGDGEMGRWGETT